MLESGLTVARFFSTNYDSLLRIATNEIASFWIHQITSNGFFSCKMKAGQNAGFRVMLKYFEIKKAFRYYIKQIDSMLPCVWFSNRSQQTSKCGKNISDTLGYVSCATYLLLPHFDVICDLLLNRRTATWNLFVNQKSNKWAKRTSEISDTKQRVCKHRSKHFPCGIMFVIYILRLNTLLKLWQLYLNKCGQTTITEREQLRKKRKSSNKIQNLWNKVGLSEFKAV